MKKEIVNSIEIWKDTLNEALLTCTLISEVELVMDSIRRIDINQFDNPDEANELKGYYLDKFADLYRNIEAGTAYRNSQEYDENKVIEAMQNFLDNGGADSLHKLKDVPVDISLFNKNTDLVLFDKMIADIKKSCLVTGYSNEAEELNIKFMANINLLSQAYRKLFQTL